MLLSFCGTLLATICICLSKGKAGYIFLKINLNKLISLIDNYLIEQSLKFIDGCRTQPKFTRINLYTDTHCKYTETHTQDNFSQMLSCSVFLARIIPFQSISLTIAEKNTGLAETLPIPHNTMCHTSCKMQFKLSHKTK